MIAYAKKLGFLNTIHYACGSDKDLKYLEYLATYRYAVENVQDIFRKPGVESVAAKKRV